MRLGTKPAAVLTALLAAAACSPRLPAPKIPAQPFLRENSSSAQKYATAEVLKQFEDALPKEYLLGPGDILEVVSAWTEVSGEYTIGPEGRITIHPAGDVVVGGVVRGEAERRIKNALDRFYENAGLTLRVKSYENNVVYVLGRVGSPGAVRMKGLGTLLEAISLAAVFPVLEKTAFPSTCTIFRGRSKVLWVDLQDLLFNANTEFNIRLAPNDVIYIPDPQESNVFVLGEVVKPGAYEIKNVLTVLSAIGLADGLTENASRSRIHLIRDRDLGGKVVTINLNRLLKSGDFSQNYRLQRNDIIFVPKTGFGRLNYILRMLSPLTGLLLLQGLFD